MFEEETEQWEKGTEGVPRKHCPDDVELSRVGTRTLESYTIYLFDIYLLQKVQVG